MSRARWLLTATLLWVPRAGAVEIRDVAAPAASGPVVGLRMSPLLLGSQSISSCPTLPAGVPTTNLCKSDLGSSFAITPYLDYRIGRYFSVGFGPEFNVHLPTNYSSDTGREVDLNVRLMAMIPVHHRISLYLRVEPGAALTSLPGSDLQTGFHLGSAVGASFGLSRDVRLLFDVGYATTFAWHTLSVADRLDPSAKLAQLDYTTRTGFLSLNVGFEYAF
jgi:hypothetical protein